MPQQNKPDAKVLGWREWVSLPELGLGQVKAKIDTGARTSAIHAFKVLQVGNDVHFQVHPLQSDIKTVVSCIAPIKDVRNVRDSGGHLEERFVIETPLQLGGELWPVELTLTSRDDMRFRLLIGRTAIRGRFLVDASRSYLVSKRGAPGVSSTVEQ